MSVTTSILMPTELSKIIDDMVAARKTTKFKKPPLTPEQLSEALAQAKISLAKGQEYIDRVQGAGAGGKASRSSVIVDLLMASPEIQRALAPPKPPSQKPKRTAATPAT